MTSTLWAVSRAPLPKLQAYKRRMGWTFPWASSFGDDFNFDFNVSITEEQQRGGGVEYNYRRGDHPLTAAQVPEPVARFAATCGTDGRTYMRDRPGMSAFAHGGRRRLPRLFHLCARPGRALGRLSVARPRAEGAQRARASGGAAATNTPPPTPANSISQQELNDGHAQDRIA